MIPLSHSHHINQIRMIPTEWVNDWFFITFAIVAIVRASHSHWIHIVDGVVLGFIEIQMVCQFIEYRIVGINWLKFTDCCTGFCELSLSAMLKTIIG